MSSAYFCDKCGRAYPYENVTTIKAYRHDGGTRRLVGDLRLVCVDLCPNCVLKLDDWITSKVIPQEPKTGHCKDCKYFELDSWANYDGIPIIVAHEICKAWGDGCKTKSDGYCFRFEPRESDGDYEIVRKYEEQEPKTGHWISHREHCENLGVIPSGLGAYKWCSECDCGIDVREWHRNPYNFCPNCGAKMVEPQESESDA